jgi:hypothetical protein
MTHTDRDSEYRLRELHAALDRRIEALEDNFHARRRLRAVSFLAAVLALGLSILGLTRVGDALVEGEVYPVLEMRTLVLRDGEGLERAALRIAEDGNVSLSLRDGDARARLRLSVLSDGSPGVSLLDEEGDTRAILGFLPDGTTTLVFADAGSIARSVLALTPDGASRIVFSDALGDTRAAVGVDGDGRPEVNTMAAIEGGT